MMQGVTENEKLWVFNKKRVKSDSVTTGHDGQSAKGRKRKKKTATFYALRTGVPAEPVRVTKG